MQKLTWDELNHEKKIDLLKSLNDQEIIQHYLPSSMKADAFEKLLFDERELWRPGNLGLLKKTGQPPKKETVIGAFRDLNKSEALLELTDNSIDAWFRRRRLYPKETAPQLKIYIDVDESTQTLRYEDNAGGVQEDNLSNLVIPGYSETEATDRTIGSYKTGGKKAIFKLAVEANIRTRYWNPVNDVLDDAFGIHLDKDWLQDSPEYEFPYYRLNNKSEIEKGQTVYTLRLRECNAWGFDTIAGIANDLKRTYTLLMVKYPEIEIYLNDRAEALAPLDDMYKFSGTHTDDIDIRPQRITFKHEEEWKGRKYSLDIEIVLGCRTTTAPVRDDDVWGVDLYGNDRLFIDHDQETIPQWYDIPTGNSRVMMRGYINIKGPNIMIPWDTHKRHLNEDSSLVNVLRKDRYIREFFADWGKVYSAIARRRDISDTIKQRIEPWKQRTAKSQAREVNVAFSYDLTLTERRRNIKLPDSVQKPHVPIPKSAQDENIELKFSVTKDEFRRLSTKFNVEGTSDNSTAKKSLAEAVKNALLRTK